VWRVVSVVVVVVVVVVFGVRGCDVRFNKYDSNKSIVD
jgi:hypothetical protein